MNNYITFELAKLLWFAGYKLDTTTVFNSEGKPERKTWSSGTITDFSGMYISRYKVYEVLNFLIKRGIHIQIIPPIDVDGEYTAFIRQIHNAEVIDVGSSKTYNDAMNNALITATKSL